MFGNEEDKKKKGKGKINFGGGGITAEDVGSIVRSTFGATADMAEVAANTVAAAQAAQAAAQAASDAAAALADSRAEEAQDAIEEAARDVEQSIQDDAISAVAGTAGDALQQANINAGNINNLGVAVTSLGTDLAAQDLRLAAVESIMPDDDSALAARVAVLESLPADDDSALESRISALEAVPEDDDSALLSSLEAQATQISNLIGDDVLLSQRLDVLESATDSDTVYDDSAVVGRLDVLEAAPDNDTVYDDTALSDRVSLLETAPDNDTVYDDTALSDRVGVLESAPDNDTVYDDTALAARVTTNTDDIDDRVIRSGDTGLGTMKFGPSPTTAPSIQLRLDAATGIRSGNDAIVQFYVEAHETARFSKSGTGAQLRLISENAGEESSVAFLNGDGLSTILSQSSNQVSNYTIRLPSFAPPATLGQQSLARNVGGNQLEWAPTGAGRTLRTTNANVTTDLNTPIADNTLVPVVGTVELSDGGFQTANGTTVTILLTGRYKIRGNLHLAGDGQRQSVHTRLRINGVDRGTISATGYIRQFGHTQTSLPLVDQTFDLSIGDTISLHAWEGALTTGTVTLAEAGTSFLEIEEVTRA